VVGDAVHDSGRASTKDAVHDSGKASSKGTARDVNMNTKENYLGFIDDDSDMTIEYTP
jgi:hypothetical protein